MRPNNQAQQTVPTLIRPQNSDMRAAHSLPCNALAASYLNAALLSSDRIIAQLNGKPTPRRALGQAQQRCQGDCAKVRYMQLSDI